MPDLSILQPEIATGVVKDITPDSTFTWYGNTPTLPCTQSNVVNWEIFKGTRQIAQPNVPDAEANMVSRKGRKQMAEALVAVREKELVPGSQLNFSQVFGETGAERERAEAIAGRALTNLHDRATRFYEWCWWNALQGHVVWEGPEVSVDVDYQFSASHVTSATTSWDTATQVQIRSDVKAIKTLIQHDSQVNATDAYCSQEVVDAIVDAFAKNNALGLMTEQMKTDYANDGTFTNFLGLNWHTVTETYDDASGALTNYLPVGRILFANTTQNSPLALAEGTSGDTEIAQDNVGLFSKSWDNHDPSGRTFLVGYNALPIIYLPDQIAVFDALS